MPFVFEPDALSEVPNPAIAAVAARAIHRCLPLYPRFRQTQAELRDEVELLDRSLLWARTYCAQGVWRGAFERMHNAVGNFALRLMHNEADLSAVSMALACSELCLGLTEWSAGHRHAGHTVLNNALRAASLTESGLESILRVEIEADIRHYRQATPSQNLAVLDVKSPLWSGPVPSWFFDPAAEGLLHSFDTDQEIAGRTIIEVTHAVGHELRRVLSKDTKLLFAIPPRAFEQLVADIWSDFGFDVELTQQTRDKGRDIIAVRHSIIPITYIIECKRLREGKRVDVQAVRALWYVKSRDRAVKAILATTGRFGKDTREEFADPVWGLELRDFDSIVRWLGLSTRQGPDAAP